MYRVFGGKIEERSPVACADLYAEEVLAYEQAKADGTLGITVGLWFSFEEDAQLFIQTGDDSSPHEMRFLEDLIAEEEIPCYDDCTIETGKHNGN